MEDIFKMGGPLEKSKDPHAEDIFKMGGGLGQGFKAHEWGDIVKMGGIGQNIPGSQLEWTYTYIGVGAERFLHLLLAYSFKRE